MHFDIYDVLYSLYSHEHVLASIMAIFRVVILYKNTNVQIWLTVSPLLHNN
jgi:hypothetical protein